VNLDDEDSHESRQISNVPMQSTEVQKQSIPETAEQSDTLNAVQDSQHSPASTSSKEGTSVERGKTPTTKRRKVGESILKILQQSSNERNEII
jgi:hypothetical protein